MQDRFKFRFYDNDKKIMIDENSDIKYIANIYGRDEWWWCIEAKMPKILSYFDEEGFVEGKWSKRNFAIMQCTGLKDKNGKLIYEGDILKGKKDMICSPHSSKMVDKVGVVEIPQNMFVASCRDVKNNCTLFCQNDWVKTEVIGNIYQNPELLED